MKQYYRFLSNRSAIALAAVNPTTGKILGVFGAALRMRLSVDVDIVVQVTPEMCGDAFTTSSWPTPKVIALRTDEERKPYRAVFTPDCKPTSKNPTPHDRVTAAIESLMCMPGAAPTPIAWVIISCFAPSGKQTVGSLLCTANEVHALGGNWAPVSTRMASNVVDLESMMDCTPIEGVPLHQAISEMIPSAWNVAQVGMRLFGGIRELPTYEIPPCQVAFNCLAADANNAAEKHAEYLARRRAGGMEGVKALKAIVE